VTTGIKEMFNKCNINDNCDNYDKMIIMIKMITLRSLFSFVYAVHTDIYTKSEKE